MTWYSRAAWRASIWWTGRGCHGMLITPTGDRLLTDGQAAVLRMNDCQNPRTTPTTVAQRPPRGERISRDTSLTIRNGLYRGNLIYQGISGAITVRKYLRSSSELPPDAGAWRMTDASGAQYKGYGSSPGLQNEVQGRSYGLLRRGAGGFKQQPSPAGSGRNREGEAGSQMGSSAL